MKNYKIEISRTDYRVKTFEVSAENQDAAIDVAMQQAYDYNWHDSSTGGSDYEVEEVISAE
jgi:hypothetical protein